MATSFRSNPTVTSTIQREDIIMDPNTANALYFPYAGSASEDFEIREGRRREFLARNSGRMRTGAAGPPMSENEREINNLMSRGVFATHRSDAEIKRIAKEATTLEQKIIKEKQAAEAISKRTFDEKQQDYIDDYVLTEEFRQKLFNDEEALRLAGYISKDSTDWGQVGSDLLNLGSEFGSYIKANIPGMGGGMAEPTRTLPPPPAPIEPPKDTRLPPYPSRQPYSRTLNTAAAAPAPVGGGDGGDEEFKKAYRASMKLVRTKEIDSGPIYKNSAEEKIFKQAIRKNELDKGNAYFIARLKNRQDDVARRVENNMLREIPTRGHRTIAPMNSASFDMVVGYP